MKVKRSSWHCKISNLGSFERSNDNLCCYFWRLVGKVILFVAAMIIIGFSIGVIIYWFFMPGFWISNTIMLLFIYSIFALPILTIYFLRRKLGKSLEMPYGNIVVEYMAAKKKKVCPLIEYI